MNTPNFVPAIFVAGVLVAFAATVSGAYAQQPATGPLAPDATYMQTQIDTYSQLLNEANTRVVQLSGQIKVLNAQVAQAISQVDAANKKTADVQKQLDAAKAPADAPAAPAPAAQ